MPTFTFADTSHDPLNNHLLPSDPDHTSFKVDTSFTRYTYSTSDTSSTTTSGPKLTTLASESPAQFVGAINWLDKTFEVEGVRRPFEEVKGPNSIFYAA